MRQDQDVQYTLLSIRCLMYSDRMRTDAISESMYIVVQCNSGAAIPYVGAIQDRIYMYILENSTACTVHVQTSCNTH